jgi:hypothetical protein
MAADLQQVGNLILRPLIGFEFTFFGSDCGLGL